MEKYVLGPNAARKFKELMRGKGGVDRRPGSASGLAFDAEYAHPFAVQWAQSVGSQGSWIIWLPSDAVLTIGGSRVIVTDELDPAGGDYPEGWYILDIFEDADEGGEIYLSAGGSFSAEDDGASILIAEVAVDAETGARSVRQNVTSAIVSAGNPKPFDITTEIDEETGAPRRVMVRCAISNDGLTVLDDWASFPEIEEGETATIYLRAVKPEKEDIDDRPHAEYSIVSKIDGEDWDEEDIEGLIDYYPLYKLDATGAILTDYRDAFIRPLSWHTDENSIGQDDYPRYPTVLTLSHFYDSVRDVTLTVARAKAQCDIVVRMVVNTGERPKIHYVPLRQLIALIGGGGGGGGGGEDDPDDPDDPDNPPGGDDDVVTSLNGVDGDLVLRLHQGWLEIVRGGQAVKAIGVVTTSVSGLYGDMAVIGGKKIRVEQEGNSLKISYDDEKEEDDTNPFPDSPEACEHPSGGGGVLAGGGGGGGGVQGGGGESSGGDSCCGGASATGESATGTPAPGVSGKPATGSGANGKEVTEAPSGGSSSGGKEAGGGLFNGSTIPKKRIEDTNTHGALTDTKKMTESPFKSDPNWKGSIEQTQANAKKPIYSGTHNQLTDTKKMNESPFKRK